MKAALPRDVSLNILFVIDICKLTLEEKGKLQEDLFGVGACWNNSQRVIIEEGTDNSVGYYFIYPNRRITYLQKDHNIFDFTFDRIVDKDTALNLNFSKVMKKKAIALIDYIDDDGMIAFQVNQRVNIIEFTDNCLVKTKYGYIKISKEYLKIL